MDDINALIARVAMGLIIMILSLTVHEFAHAFAAKRLGDDTAMMMGRLTLNPIPHIDPIGTLALPILLSVTGSPIFFGWAKPVPVNPVRFSRKLSMRTGMLIVAAAGPVSNLVIATLCMGTLAAGYHAQWLPQVMAEMLFWAAITNLALAVFNMIPVGPLDGQKVLAGLLSGETAVRFERFNVQFGMWLLIGVIFFGSHIVGGPMRALFNGIASVFGLPLRI